MSQAKPDEATKLRVERLPCRGCTRNCKLYSVCHGTPWRLEAPKAHH
jgi:hypothetical protein